MPTISYSTSQAAIQLSRTNSSWGSAIGDAKYNITYAFRSTAPTYEVDGSASTFQRFSSQQITAAREALKTWADVARVSFVEQNAGGYSNSGVILFGNYTDFSEGAAGGFAWLPTTKDTASTSYEGDIWINTAFNSWTSLSYGSYECYTILHEVGHSLGLSHPADYNAGAIAPTYTQDAIYIQDTIQYTIMSYFSESFTGGNFSYSGTDYHPSTLMMHDIAAIQRLHGADYTVRSLNTTYGFNSNATHFDGTASPYQITNSGQERVFCIWDGGGYDRLDLSGYSTNQTISLVAGTFSNAGHLIGNISIAAGVTIEDAIGGSGNDRLTGNSTDNRLTGGRGLDLIDGGAGTDTAIYTDDNTISWTYDFNLTYRQDAFGTWNYYQSATVRDGQFAGTYDCLISIENVFMGGGADWIYGNSQSNEIWAGAGDDHIQAGSGTDYIYGESGTDYAILTSSYASYSIVSVSQASGQVIINGAEGYDTFLGVEYFQFADQTVWWQSLGGDNTPPSLTGKSPADDSTNVSVGANVVLSFSETVTAGSGNILIYNSNGTLAKSIAVTDTGQVTVSGNTVTINPSTDLTAGSSYYINLAAGVIRDSAGNNYAGISDSTTFNFSTATPQLPDLVVSNLAVGATTVQSGSTTSTSFTVGNIGSWPAQSIVVVYLSDDPFITNSDRTLSAVDTTFLSAGDSRNISGYILNFGGLAAGTYYLGGIIDYNNFVPESREDNNLSNIITITVTAPSDTTPPSLTGLSPSDNSANVPVGANIVLSFSEAVTAGSGNILIYNSNGTIAKTIAVTDGSQVSFSGGTLTINPSTDLAPGSGYYVNFAAGVIRDVVGNNFGGISDSTTFNFTTVASAVTTLDAAGATSLTKVGNSFYLYAAGTSTGPVLMADGAPFAAGQFGPWTPIGAEKTASGYQVAWKNAGTGQFMVWNTDNSGTYTGYAIAPSAGEVVRAIESSFRQDLNGDGVTGLATTAIETAGATRLTRVGDNFFLFANGTSTGPALRADGVSFVAGQFGGWTPIGAEATAGGYQVAWKQVTTGEFMVWNTDTNGNYTGYAMAPSTGAALPAFEASFRQDINADGATGLATAAIETAGATSLTQVGGNFYLYAAGTSTGPTLKAAGAPFEAGQFGGWTPIGAEATGGGYQVAWKHVSTGEYMAWNTDTNGNYTGYAVAPSSGAAVASIETSFRQDLNGDGFTGPSPTSIETVGATSLTRVGNSFYLYAAGTSTGPALRADGAPFAAGQFGGWTPIGAEATASGYQVAWKQVTTGEFMVWNTDTNGNYTGYAVAPSVGAAMRAIEASFRQDLNGDGVTGLATTSIETVGASSLIQVGGNFYLYAAGTSTGPTLKAAGAPFEAGQFGGWTPIGAEATASGYQVAWKQVITGEFMVWNTDTNGNYTGYAMAPSTGASLPSVEASFWQDLNGDGLTGLSTAAIETAGQTSLTHVGANYYMYTTETSSGPALMADGVVFSSGQFGPWTPIGAEKTVSGYLVAWQDASTNQYNVWNTDNNGVFTGYAVGVGSAHSAALQSIETSFAQDLNSDGVVGIRTA